MNSSSALVDAFKGEDAVICTLNVEVLAFQAKYIEAAVEAGVKRFIPSEWGSHHIKTPATEMAQVFAGKAALVNFLDKKSKEASASGKEFHWTGVNNGVFFDW